MTHHKEDSGRIDLTEMQDHDEAPFNDLDGHEEEEIGAASILLAWILVVGFIAACAVAIFGEWANGVSR